MARILLIEDDPRIVSFIRRGLEAEGHVVEMAQTAVAGLNLARENDFPLLILDRMLPDMDGIEICRQLRQERVDSRILMLTAKDTMSHKVSGLRAGADDYLTKPFSFDEFVVRVKALLRCLMESPGVVLSRAELLNNVWGLRFDPGTKVLDVYIR